MRASAEEAADKMLAQVIQAVQVVFAENPRSTETAAVIVVDEFCKIMYFRRKDLQELNPLHDSRVYRDSNGLKGMDLASKLRRRSYSRFRWCLG